MHQSPGGVLGGPSAFVVIEDVRDAIADHAPVRVDTIYDAYADETIILVVREAKAWEADEAGCR